MRSRPRYQKKGNGGRATRAVNRAVTTCRAHGKQVFLVKKDAKARARVMSPGDHATVYPCSEVPDGWHWGHLPKAVRTGEEERETYVDRVVEREQTGVVQPRVPQWGRDKE